MTVTGTEQRVYGTLTGGCIIDLHRFALVSGSTTQSPTKASTVTYADTTPYKQCGYKYAGYLTLFLSISGSSVYAAVEVRICKNDPKRIVIETYGEVAKTVTGGMSLWFNKGTDKHFPTRDDFPETGSSNVNYINDATGKYYIWNETLYEEGSCWVKLNSTTSGVKMPYATTSYTFKETKRNGSTTIDCCKKCPSCGCKVCNIDNIYIKSSITTAHLPLYCIMYLSGYYIIHDPYVYTSPPYEATGTLSTNKGPYDGPYLCYSNCAGITKWVYSTDSLYDTYVSICNSLEGTLNVPSGESAYNHFVYLKYTCNKIYIGCEVTKYWFGDTIEFYYIDESGTHNCIATFSNGSTDKIDIELPFDYLKNCIPCWIGYMETPYPDAPTIDSQYSSFDTDSCRPQWATYNNQTITFNRNWFGECDVTAQVTYTCIGNSEVNITASITFDPPMEWLPGEDSLYASLWYKSRSNSSWKKLLLSDTNTTTSTTITI